MKIKVTSPSDGQAYEKWWGDYWAKIFLQESLKKQGYEVTESNPDINIALCNGHSFQPLSGKINIAWIYTRHNECFNRIDYFKQFDHVFCLAINGNKDFERYNIDSSFLPVGTNRVPDNEIKITNDVIFIGNAGKMERRNLIKSMIDANIDLKIYGTLWDKIDFSKKHWVKNYYPNEDLNKLYISSKINLICHEKGMHDTGMVAIKVLDIVASKGFCLCDNNIGLTYYFKNMPTYSSSQDAIEKIKYYLKENKIREDIIDCNYKDVQKFQWINVAEKISIKIQEIIKTKD